MLGHVEQKTALPLTEVKAKTACGDGDSPPPKNQGMQPITPSPQFLGLSAAFSTYKLLFRAVGHLGKSPGFSHQCPCQPQTSTPLTEPRSRTGRAATVAA